MINSILNYILRREAYRKYTDLRNLNSTDKMNLFNNLGTFAWLFMWSVLCISAMFRFNFMWGLSLFFVPVSFIRVVSSFFSARKKTRPIYSDVPIKKSDRRYKTSYRTEGYKQVVTGYVALKENEIIIQRNHFKGRMYLWCVILCISSSIFAYNYSKKSFNDLLIEQDPWSNAKIGDSVFISKSAFIENKRITIYQQARPINKNDIEVLKISDKKKRQMIKQINATLGKTFFKSLELNSEVFYKSNSSCIGTLKMKLKRIVFEEEEEEQWFEIIPLKFDYKKIAGQHKNYILENRYFVNANLISRTDYMKKKKN